MSTQDTLSKLSGFKNVCGAARTWFQSMPKDASSDDQWADCPNGAWLLWRLLHDPKIESADADARATIVSIVQHCMLAAIDAASPPDKNAFVALANGLGPALVAQDPAAACDALRKQWRDLPDVITQTEPGAVRDALATAILVVRAAADGFTRQELAHAHQALVSSRFQGSIKLLATYADIVRAHIPKVSALSYVTHNAAE